MRGKRALFISRVGALQFGVDYALKEGFTHEVCMQRVRHYPVYHRGEIKGFECWVPHGTGARPVTEDMVA